MTTIITKGTRSHAQFLGYDSAGNHEWKKDRLDAIRFNGRAEAQQAGGVYLDSGAKVKSVDPWDGHYEAYGEHEVQAFREKFGSKPGGKRWRFRVGLIDNHRPYEYSRSGLGYTTFENAIRAARAFVDKKRHAVAS